MAKTFTLDAMKDGKYFEDHGLTQEQVNNAKKNAEGLGITILGITEEKPIPEKGTNPILDRWFN